jgi:hypothetical protein
MLVILLAIELQFKAYVCSHNTGLAGAAALSLATSQVSMKKIRTTNLDLLREMFGGGSGKHRLEKKAFVEAFEQLYSQYSHAGAATAVTGDRTVAADKEQTAANSWANAQVDATNDVGGASAAPATVVKQTQQLCPNKECNAPKRADSVKFCMHCGASFGRAGGNEDTGSGNGSRRTSDDAHVHVDGYGSESGSGSENNYAYREQLATSVDSSTNRTDSTAPAMLPWVACASTIFDAADAKGVGSISYIDFVRTSRNSPQLFPSFLTPTTPHTGLHGGGAKGAASSPIDNFAVSLTGVRCVHNQANPTSNPPLPTPVRPSYWLCHFL